MSEQFKVGTICIGQNFVHAVHRNNMECEIIDGLSLRKMKESTTGEVDVAVAYKVKWADGETVCVRPSRLRRKPPKADHTAWAAEKVRDLIAEKPVAA